MSRNLSFRISAPLLPRLPSSLFCLLCFLVFSIQPALTTPPSSPALSSSIALGPRSPSQPHSCTFSPLYRVLPFPLPLSFLCSAVSLDTALPFPSLPCPPLPSPPLPSPPLSCSFFLPFISLSVSPSVEGKRLFASNCGCSVAMARVAQRCEVLCICVCVCVCLFVYVGVCV